MTATGTETFRNFAAAAAAVASAGVAAMSSRYLFGTPLWTPRLDQPTVDLSLPLVFIVVVAAVAAAGTAFPVLRRGNGWPVALVGLLAVAACVTSVQSVFQMSLAVRTAIAVSLAVSVGGVVIAAATASLPQRIGVAAGLAAGLAAKEYLLNPVLPGSNNWPAGLTDPLALVLVTAAAVALAAVLAWRAPASELTQPRPWVPVLVIAAVAAGIELGRRLLERSIMDELLNHSGSGLDAILEFSHYSSVGIAVVAAAMLIWCAYRRGRADLACWAALGLALTGPLTAGVLTVESFQPQDKAVIIAAGVVGALLGALLARSGPAGFPWEVVGAVIAAAGLAVTAPLRSLTELGYASAYPAVVVLLVGAPAFAIASGLTRVRLVHDAASLTLGLAVAVLAGFAMRPTVLRALHPSQSELSIAVVSVSALAIVLIVVLHRVSRSEQRSHGEIRKQAETQP